MKYTQKNKETPSSYLGYAQHSLDKIIEHGTDRYGEIKTPVLAAILDVGTLESPRNPEALDEDWRVVRRGRRNPGGANLYFDLPTLDTMHLVSAATGDEKYKNFADTYMAWWMDNLIDTRPGREGIFWWGWHYFYNIFTDSKMAFVDGETPGSQAAYHETHQTISIPWEKLWSLNPAAVQRQIEMSWEWHVVDKSQGRINRHDQIEPFHLGYDFSMTAASLIHAFAFLHTKLGNSLWLDRAKLLTNYYWNARNTTTNLIPEAPYAQGGERFDKHHFTTAAAGLHTHGLFKAYELTGEAFFRDRAVAYLKAYAEYGYDAETGKFWGSLNLDGTPVPGPLTLDDYAAYEPRGHLDLWQPYAAGYEYPMYAAMAFAYGYQLTHHPDLLLAARRFAAFIESSLPPEQSLVTSIYGDYSEQYATAGTHAVNYAHLISFYVNLYILTGEESYLEMAKSRADNAIEKLYYNGLFRSHPAKPYYENIDGVGFLLYALIQLDALLADPAKAVEERALNIGEVPVDFDNW